MEFTYQTLNFWRKFVIWLQFSIPVLALALFVFGLIRETLTSEQGAQLFVLGLFFFLTALFHWYAISRRKMWALWSLLALNLLTINIIYLLITLSIIRVTRREIEELEASEKHENWTLVDNG